MWICSSCAASIAFAPIAGAASFAKKSPYALLSDTASQLSASNSTKGWAYIISGGIALGVGIPAYYASSDVFAKAVYSIGQTLGVAAIGYGSYLVLVDDEYTRFHQTLLSVPSLTPGQRDQLARSFFEQNARKARAVRKIRVISHGLTAALNITDGITSSQTELKETLFFLAGINVLAALSYGFGRSDEEKTLDQVAVEPLLGPLVGMRVSF